MKTNTLISFVFGIVLAALAVTIGYDALTGCADTVDAISRPLFTALN